MGAPCNIDMNSYADEYIIGVDFTNVEIAEAEEMINEDVAVKFELKEDN